jgi:hypothetical protein
MTAPPRPLQKNPQVLHQALAGDQGGVLLDVGSGEYFGVNELGSLIWELIDGRRSEAEIAAAVRAEVDDPPKSLEDDVSAFLGALRERRLAVESE